jgi:predicted ATPase
LARHCLTLDPLNEEATFALAEATALAGGKAEALRMIERYEREIGTHPELSVPTRILKSRVSDLAAELGIGRVRRVPLVGRESELEWLLTVLSDVSRGLSRSVCLVGDGGIGKTALVEEFLRMASLRNASCVRVRCQASDAERPLSAACDVLSGLLALRGALGASPTSLDTIKPLISYQSKQRRPATEDGIHTLDRRQVFDAAADIMDAVGDEGLLVVFVDDVHWIDDESTRLLSGLCRRTQGSAFLLIGCGRVLLDHSTSRGLGRDSSTEYRRLRPLHSPAARRLVTLLVQDNPVPLPDTRVEDLLRLAGGNPLFLVELARRITERPYGTLPETLATLLQARIEARSSLGLTVLQTCSVLGKHASIDRLERLLELPTFQLTAALNELEESALIGREGESVACRHELIAAAAELVLPRFRGHRV